MAMSVSMLAAVQALRGKRAAVLTARALMVNPNQPQEQQAAGQADETVDQYTGGSARGAGRQLGGHLDF